MKIEQFKKVYKYDYHIYNMERGVCSYNSMVLNYQSKDFYNDISFIKLNKSVII